MEVYFKYTFKYIKFSMKNKERRGNSIHFNGLNGSKPYLKIEPFKDPKNQPYQRKKNSTSVQVLQLHKQRMKRLEAAYRQLSQKKCRSKSNERSQKKGQNDYYVKIPFNSMTMQNKNTNNQTKRLLIRSKTKQENAERGHQPYIEKMEQLMEIKNDRVFVDQFEQFRKEYQDAQLQNKNNPGNILKNLDICFVRKYEKILQKLLHQQKIIEKEKQIVQINQKKNKQTIHSLHEKIAKLEKQNREINSKLNTQKSSKQTQTSIESTSTEAQTTQQNKVIIGLIKRQRQFEKRQKQLLSVLYLLKKDGVNIEKAYQDMCTKKSDQLESSDTELQQQFEEFAKMKKQQNQSILQKIPLNRSYDADDSIVSSIDALSFNFKDKNAQLQSYTPRRVYICEKQLTPSLKDKLKLNFECLYEQESNNNSVVSLPTV